jgi:hypothetical protein
VKSSRSSFATTATRSSGVQMHGHAPSRDLQGRRGARRHEGASLRHRARRASSRTWTTAATATHVIPRRTTSSGSWRGAKTRCGPHPHVNILDTGLRRDRGRRPHRQGREQHGVGRGHLREPVDDANQTLDDAEIHYAKLGTWCSSRCSPSARSVSLPGVRHPAPQPVVRIDAIGRPAGSCPRTTASSSPVATYLQTASYKVFDPSPVDGLEFKRAIKRPTAKTCSTSSTRRDGATRCCPTTSSARRCRPHPCHGYSLFDDGGWSSSAHHHEPTRVHPMQVWQTPFTLAEFAAAAPTDGSFLVEGGQRRAGARHLGRLRHRPARRTPHPVSATRSRTSSGPSSAHDRRLLLGGPRRGDADLRPRCVELPAHRRAHRRRVREGAGPARARRERHGGEEGAGRARCGHTRRGPHGIEAFMATLAAFVRQRGRAGGRCRTCATSTCPSSTSLEKAVVEQFERVSQGVRAFLLGPRRARAAHRAQLTQLQARSRSARVKAKLEPLHEAADEVNDGLTCSARSSPGSPWTTPRAHAHPRGDQLRGASGSRTACARRSRRAAKPSPDRGPRRVRRAVQALSRRTWPARWRRSRRPSACDAELGG